MLKKILAEYQGDVWSRAIADNLHAMPRLFQAWFILTHYANKCGHWLAWMAGVTAAVCALQIISGTWMVGGVGLLSDSTWWPYLYLSTALMIAFQWVLPVACNIVLHIWYGRVERCA